MWLICQSGLQPWRSCTDIAQLARNAKGLHSLGPAWPSSALLQMGPTAVGLPITQHSAAPRLLQSQAKQRLAVQDLHPRLLAAHLGGAGGTTGLSTSEVAGWSQSTEGSADTEPFCSALAPLPRPPAVEHRDQPVGAGVGLPGPCSPLMD